jgi:hypothetical protein
MSEDSEIKKDDLEHKLDEIRTVLGIQKTATTATTSSVLDGIKSQIDRVDKKLTNERWMLWFCLLPMQIGIAFVIAGGDMWWVSIWNLVVTCVGLVSVTWGFLNLIQYFRKVKIDKQTSGA